MNKKINYVIDELVDQYIDNDKNRPWIIGFSGGKDSTVLLTLVWMALLKVKNHVDVKYLRREIWVVCNDTLVENPVITNYVNKVLKKIEQAAIKHNMPIKIKITKPKVEDSFWLNLIGKGYPAPNNSFRWCTERLKIKPTSKFIDSIVSQDKQSIVLIGTRKSESASRAKSIKKHEIRGKRLTKHPIKRNTLVYSPIKELALEEIWYIINTFESPWGADNHELFKIYSDASADDYECPTMVSNKDHKSCGQSRFGCWTCTVVAKDKSISAQIENGQKWLIPLKNLRDWIQFERNKTENRDPRRRNGLFAINNMGVVNLKHRIEILTKVFEAQKTINEQDIDIELINTQELIAIQIAWYRDLFFKPKVSELYNQVFNKHFSMKQHSETIKKEEEILLAACNGDDKQFHLIKNLLAVQKSKLLMSNKRIDKTILEKYNQFIQAS